jgi:predicted 2-oxoglutarate/Fe(II)-dependent dioxygenase YbiX
MILYNKEELDFLNWYWENTDNRKFKDRSYEFTVIGNNELNITTKLLNWFENQSGEKLKSYNYNLIIHRYNIGDYFGKHIDAVERGYKNRAYVLGFHINNDYMGGEYKLYNPDFIIDKTPGVPYFFKSDREHEITRITNGVRKSALIFINYEDLIREGNLI